MTDSPSFIDDSINNILRNSPTEKVSPWLVLETIVNNPSISIYQIAKLVSKAYPTIQRICRDLEFAGLVKSHLTIGDNNREVRLFIATKKEEARI